MRSALRPCEFYQTERAGSAPLLAALPRGEWAHQPLYRRGGERRHVKRFECRRPFRIDRFAVHAERHGV